MNTGPQKQERRRCARIKVAKPVRILGDGVGEWDGTVINLSEGGACVESFCPLNKNESCAIAFEIMANGVRRRVNAWGTVVYTALDIAHNVRLGIKFVDMDTRSQALIRELQRDPQSYR